MRPLSAALLCCASASVSASASATDIAPVLPAAAPVTSSAPVVASGTVADEASKAALLQRLRDLYGAGRVVDRIAIGSVAMPPNWSAHVQKLLVPNLKLISKGELAVEGNNVSLRGDVLNEAVRQQIASDAATSLNPTYTVRNGLRVATAAQELLDSALAGRIVEFESGRAALTQSGKEILDHMAAALHKVGKVGGRKVDVIGHTDSLGLRTANVALSLARAETVRAYLALKGIDPATITATGLGPDRPVADNATSGGRARNRRIEFRIAG